ncbi:MAG: BrnA antitoxin family protein [Nitrospirae bacterium]|nr:BrnA antitoxin family protein [Nitrospirota bacterium]
MKTLVSKQKKEFELKEEYDFSKGIRGRFYRPKKISASMRLDNDILLYLKKIAGERKIGYQTLINTVLREFIIKANK